MKKRFVSFLLAMIMLCSIAPVAFAASDNALEAADALHELGLFNGTGANADGTPNYDLNRAPTRHEAVTMLVRLLGKEEDAKSGTWNIPFTDVADWAKPYVGYAYTNGLTNGTSATTFGGNDTVTASQYLTFVLRALGYESGTDFQWNKAWELSDKIGLTDGTYNAQTSEFVRGDVAMISYAALSTPYANDDGTTLGEKLKAEDTAAPSEMENTGNETKEDYHSVSIAYPLLDPEYIDSKWLTYYMNLDGGWDQPREHVTRISFLCCDVDDHEAEVIVSALAVKGKDDKVYRYPEIHLAIYNCDTGELVERIDKWCTVAEKFGEEVSYRFEFTLPYGNYELRVQDMILRIPKDEKRSTEYKDVKWNGITVYTE